MIHLARDLPADTHVEQWTLSHRESWFVCKDNHPLVVYFRFADAQEVTPTVVDPTTIRTNALLIIQLRTPIQRIGLERSPRYHGTEPVRARTDDELLRLFAYVFEWRTLRQFREQWRESV